jgi:tripartite-type tricarboxylate transporter receptor subunit TctC
MKLPRRKFLHLATSAAALPAVSRLARAQTYPTRPVRIVVGFPPGGSGDILARIVGQWLQGRLGQPFVIENRPGGGSNIAAEAVVRAQPDGYTLYLASSANAIGASLYANLNFDFIRDLAHVAGIMRTALIMEVNPSVPATTVPEFIAYAKAISAKPNMASNGNGTTSHLAGELFKKMAGIDLVHVPYRGAAPALTDLIGGQVQVMFDFVFSSAEYVKVGKLRALGVTTTTRSVALPDVPSLSEFVQGYEAIGWFGISSPKKTPAAIVEKLNNEINEGLADPKLQARLAELGGSALTGSSAQFGKFVADETQKWATVVKFAGIKPE